MPVAKMASVAVESVIKLVEGQDVEDTIITEPVAGGGAPWVYRSASFGLTASGPASSLLALDLSLRAGRRYEH